MELRTILNEKVYRRCALVEPKSDTVCDMSRFLYSIYFIGHPYKFSKNAVYKETTVGTWKIKVGDDTICRWRDE